MDTFLSHGSLTLSIDDKIPARHFFKSWVPAKVAGNQPPRAILVVSGHWETATPSVNVIRGSNDTIYDFYGFPKPMYQHSVWNLVGSFGYQKHKILEYKRTKQHGDLALVEYRGLDLVDWCTAVHNKISEIKMILFLATAFLGISAGALLSLKYGGDTTASSYGCLLHD